MTVNRIEISTSGVLQCRCHVFLDKSLPSKLDRAFASTLAHCAGTVCWGKRGEICTDLVAGVYELAVREAGTGPRGIGDGSSSAANLELRPGTGAVKSLPNLFERVKFAPTSVNVADDAILDPVQLIAS